MGHRLSRICTRTGDKDSTEPGGDGRVDKDHLRVEAFGTVDELKSVIGLVLAGDLPRALREVLVDVQHDLFDLGSELAQPGRQLIPATHVARLEQVLDGFNADLPPLTEFILPGGALPPGAHRVPPRRAARGALARQEKINNESLTLPQPPVRSAVRAGARRSGRGAVAAGQEPRRMRRPVALSTTGCVPRTKHRRNP